MPVPKELNDLSEYGILMLVESPWSQKFPHVLHDNLFLEHPAQVLHSIHLLMFPVFLAVNSPQTSLKALNYCEV